MNNLTLRQRLLLLTLLPSLLMSIILVTYFTISGIKTLEGELTVKGMATVRYLAPVSEFGIIAGQIEGLHGLAQATLQEPGVKAAIIVNQKGKTIAVSGRVSLPADILRQTLSEPQVVADSTAWIGFGAPVRRSLGEVDALFEPVNGPQGAPEIVGHVFVEFDKTELAEKQRHLLQRGLVIALVGLVVLAALAIAMADNLARPVLRLVQAVRNMSSGLLDTRVPASSTGELGVLEAGFNEMAENLEGVHGQMQARIEEATAQLAFQARHDALTGLFNRREFEVRLEKALAGVKAGGEEFAVLFLDLDRFKQVNDTCGYLAGDELLRQVGQLLQGRLRDEDTLARLGGDEFCVILAGCDAQRAMQVAEDICALTTSYRFIWQDKVFAIGSSVGVTTVNRKVSNISAILAAGDAACHRAKESGRNRVCRQDAAETLERRQETSNWASRIASAINDGRLLLEAAPLRALKAQANGHHVEITARLNEPGQPAVSLAALTDAAERYDLAPRIDQILLGSAFEVLGRARRQHKNLYCIVPLSRASVGNKETAEFIAQGLSEQRLNGKHLCLMFSEDTLTYMTSQAMAFVHQIQLLGCHIGLTDFGGGLASFSHLRSICPAFVKLSGSLTHDLKTNRSSAALLRAIREIASDQGIQSIASDIETADILEQLRELGIDYAQGKAVAPCEPLDVWLEGAVMRTA